MSREIERADASDLRERAEAIHAADVALRHLGRAAELLDSAANWGRFDMLVGGVVTSLVKYRRIDDAEDEFNAARDALRRFARELSDVEGAEDMVRFDIGAVASSIDIFADNVFADIYVQSKIERARERVAEAIAQVSRIRSALMDV